MAHDNTTKIVIGIVLVIAVIGTILAFRSGYSYKSANSESPGRYGSECCTCTRAEQTLDGAVKPDTREVLFRNVMVDDCTMACAQAHEYSKMARVRYDVNAFVSDDSACKLSLPESLSYEGAGGQGGFADQPMQNQYYIAS